MNMNYLGTIIKFSKDLLGTVISFAEVFAIVIVICKLVQIFKKHTT